MSMATMKNKEKVNQDIQEWHRKANQLRSKLSEDELAKLAQEAIDAGIYNKDFGHQAAGILGWYHQYGEMTRQQFHALSYFVVPYVQHKERSSTDGWTSQWARVEKAILDVQSGATNKVRITDRTTVRAVPGGVQVEIRNRSSRVVL